MFETTEKTTAPSPEQRNEVQQAFGLSDLKQKLNRPKQEIKNSAPVNEPAKTFSQSTIEEPPPEPEIVTDTVNSEIAKMSGKAIAATVDNVVGAGLSVYAKNSEPQKYQASPAQMDQLANAWEAVAVKTGYNLQENPWLNVGLLNIGIYAPKIQDAKADRLNARMDAMQTEFEKMQAKFITMQAKISDNENTEKPAA